MTAKSTSYAHGAIVALAAAGLAIACVPARAAAQTSNSQAVGSSGDAAGIAKARADSLRYAYTDADVAFMSGMIGHHGQAIIMAGWAPSHGASPSILRLAERIINAQKDEIFTMSTWLRDRRRPVPDTNGGGMKMMMNGVEHEMLMPGMLTPEQMKQLDAARGPDFDRQFLTFMIQHHRGAVSMVRELFDTNGAAQDEVVFKFASDVQVDQTTEIDRMQKMLAILTFERGSQ